MVRPSRNKSFLFLRVRKVLKSVLLVHVLCFAHKGTRLATKRTLGSSPNYVIAHSGNIIVATSRMAFIIGFVLVKKITPYLAAWEVSDFRRNFGLKFEARIDSPILSCAASV